MCEALRREGVMREITVLCEGSQVWKGGLPPPFLCEPVLGKSGGKPPSRPVILPGDLFQTVSRITFHTSRFTHHISRFTSRFIFSDVL
jgi:hypothetical protein